MKLIYLSLILFISGCCLFRHTEKNVTLIRRYAQIDSSVNLNEAKSVIDVYTLVVPSETVDTTKPGSKSVFDLQSNGQRAIIDAFAKKDDEGQKRVSDLLNANYQEKKTTSDVPLTQDFTFVFSTLFKDFYSQITKSLSEGDRIAKLRITVSIPDSVTKGIKFLKWDHFATQFAQFNIGGTSFNVAKQATLSPSFGLSGSAATSLGSLGKASTYQENDSLQLRFVLLNGILTEDSFILDQTGTPQIDLQGNTTVNLTAAFHDHKYQTYFAFDGLQGEKGAYQRPEKVSIKRIVLPYPGLSQDINLNLKVDYVLRHIKGGDKTFAEGDDEICYYWGSFTHMIPQFVRAKDLVPKAWYITNGDSFLGLNNPTIENGYTQLAFASSDEAKDFIIWLNKVIHDDNEDIITIGKYELVAKYDFETSPHIQAYLNKKTLGKLNVAP
jgi:hypothetical protein